jgi:hypothetical protein
MKNLDFKKIKFIARSETWFDEGTEAFIDGDVFDGLCTSALFDGIKDGEEDGEICSIFEFDWFDEEGNYLNSNIPDIDSIVVHDNYIAEDEDTGKKYDYLNNVEI